MNKLQTALIVSALITGAANTLGFTLQNKQPIVQNGVHKHFFHPYMQVAMRFISNFFSLFIYFALKQKRKSSIDSPSEIKNKKMPIFLYLIPTLLDYVAVICYYTALNFIPGSVYQILRGGTVLTTFLFSYMCLKTRPTREKIIGSMVVLFGLVIVGMVNLLMGSDSGEQRLETLIGYGLILIALFGNGLHFVYEQHLILKYNVAPLLIVGMEGVFGILISLVFIPIMGLVPCGFGSQICVTNSQKNAVVEDVVTYFTEVMDNGLILAGVLIVIVSMATYNSVGVTIAKCMNSLTRAICDVSRTVIVWVVGIILTVSLGSDDKRFQWESVNEWQIFGQSVGFVTLIVGNLIYYQIISLPSEVKKNSTLIEETESESIVTV